MYRPGDGDQSSGWNSSLSLLSTVSSLLSSYMMPHNQLLLPRTSIMSIAGILAFERSPRMPQAIALYYHHLGQM